MKLLQRLVTVATPYQCLSCQAEGRLICDNCRNDLVITKRPTCYRCNRLSPAGRTCSSCRRLSKLAGVMVASHYDGNVKKLIAAIKYQNLAVAAELAGELLTPLLATEAFDVVVGVPTAAGRFRRRGYNQAELIGRAVARQLGLPYSNLLIRLGGARQVGHNRQERLRQLQGSFLAVRASRIKDRRVLLVDDVLTTGATLAECAAVLKSAGAKGVWGAVVAKH